MSSGIAFAEWGQNYSGSSPDDIPLSIACAPNTDLFFVLAVIAGYASDPTTACSDTVNGPYNNICLYFDSNFGGGSTIGAWWCRSTGTGTPTVQLSWSGGTYYGMNAWAGHWNGFTNGAVIDVSSGATPARGNSGAASYGPYTTTHANEVLIAALAGDDGGNNFATEPSGWTFRGANGPSGCIDNVVNSIQTLQTLSASLVGTNPQNWDLVFASFSDTYSSGESIPVPSGSITAAGAAPSVTPATSHVLTPLTAQRRMLPGHYRRLPMAA